MSIEIRKSIIVASGIMLIGNHVAVAGERRSLTNTDCFCSLIFEDSGLVPGDSNLVIGIWNDGVIIWSKEDIKGGSKYFRGRIPGESFKRLKNRIENYGAFEKLPFGPFRSPPDYPYSYMRLHSDTKSVALQSSHEFAELDGELVSTSSGIRIASKKTRLAKIMNSSKEELVFRILWAEIRKELELAKPDKKVITNGEIVYVGDEIFWESLP